MPDDLARNKIVSPKRDAIVAAATELFLAHGFGDVSMDAIAAKAEVSKRTVYSHFETRHNCSKASWAMLAPAGTLKTTPAFPSIRRS